MQGYEHIQGKILDTLEKPLPLEGMGMTGEMASDSGGEQNRSEALRSQRDAPRIEEYGKLDSALESYEKK